MTKFWVGVLAFGMIVAGPLISSTARFGPPPRFVKSATPDWVKTVVVEPPHKQRQVCVVLAGGKSFQIHGLTSKTPNMIAIGGDLYAERVSRRRCDILDDKTGISCSWRTNSANKEFFAGCKQPNPEYRDYEEKNLEKS